jgi:hypothetical protein
MKYIIYRISVADYIYIGSTMDYNQRKKGHKSVCNNENHHGYNLKIYQIIRENGGWDKCEMIPIEEYECEGQLQAHIQEEYWRREYNATLNTIKAYQSIEDRKEYKSINGKEYRENNKQKISERKKLYRDATKERAHTKHTCECGGKYTTQSISIHSKTQLHMDYLEQFKNISIV